MSDNILKLIPTRPEYVPKRDMQYKARDLLQSLVARDCEVTVTTTNEIEFVDAGANFESIACSICGKEIAGEWWSVAMSEAYQSRFGCLDIVTPCCQAKTSLNNLNYHWPQGFARFSLEARNPNIPNLERGPMDELEQILGCKLRLIWVHR